MKWPSKAEWAASAMRALRRKTKLRATALGLLVQRGVEAVRPDLERDDQRRAAAMLMEWIFPRIRRAERKAGLR